MGAPGKISRYRTVRHTPGSSTNAERPEDLSRSLSLHTKNQQPQRAAHVPVPVPQQPFAPNGHHHVLQPAHSVRQTQQPQLFPPFSTGQLFPSPSQPSAHTTQSQPALNRSKSSHGQKTPPSSMPKRSLLSIFRRPKSKDHEPSPPPRRDAFKAHNGLADDRVFLEGMTIRPGGGGIVPQTDAPVSAVNANTRFVTVEFKSRKTAIPVEPETSAREVIMKASPQFGLTGHPDDYVLTEIFGTVGVQRSVRAFEKVRDIMNSWESDGSNNLLIGPGKTVTTKNIPHAKPHGGQWNMKYSHKPGKWSKRVVVLRDDGQLIQGKPDKFGRLMRRGGSSSGGSTTVGEGWEKICHLSDFDIYTPTALARKNKINPPDRFCAAIKSQQKSALFLGRDGFVHFWSTDNMPEGEEFFDAVRSWRSWYRCWEMGDGRPERRDVGSSRGDRGATETSGSVRSRTTRSRNNSVSANNAAPLSISAPTGKMIDSATANWPEHIPASHGGGLGRMNSTASARKRQVVPNGADDPDAPFSTAGLLGAQYSVRQRDQLEREKEQKMAREREQTPMFSEGTLLSGAPTPTLGRSGSIARSRSTRKPTGHGRNASMTAAPSPPVLAQTSANIGVDPNHAPLVDLTPSAHLPPQHTRKGHGVAVDPSAFGRLVDLATTPDAAIKIPDRVDWRRNQAHQQAPSTPHQHQQTNGALSRHGSQRVSPPRNHGNAPGGQATLLGNIPAVSAAAPSGLSRSKSSRPTRTPSTTDGSGGTLVNYARTKSVRAPGAATARPTPSGLDDANAFVPGGLVSGARYS